MLIVQDSDATAVNLAGVVESEGFVAVRVPSAPMAAAALGSKRPVAVIVDWSLPGPGGADVCREIRRLDETIPILFVSDRTDELSVVRAFHAGADDYVAKPFRRTELLVRLEANIRRISAFKKSTLHCQCSSAARDTTEQFGEVMVDFAARTVLVDSETVSLSPLEFRLLEFMARNAGRAFSRDQLMSGIYGFTVDISTDRIDVLARRVRKRLGDGALRGDQLVTVPGFGYRLDPHRSPAK